MKRNKNTLQYKKWRERVDYNNALRHWSKLVRERDGYKCAVCSCVDRVQAHHILDKKYYKEHSLSVEVGITLCVRCHKWSKYAAHTNPIWFVSWLSKNRPEQYQWCMERISI